MIRHPAHDSDRFFVRGIDGAVTAATDLVAWAHFMEDDAGRMIEITEITEHCSVSTCFLGMHSGFRRDDGPDGPPLFETVVTRRMPHESVHCLFADSGEERWRWAREDDARAAHLHIVSRVRGDELAPGVTEVLARSQRVTIRPSRW